MKSNFDACLKAVLKHEGGYVNHPKDPGGATNKGITQGTYDMYRLRDPRSVKDISDQEVAEIYKRRYWDLVKGDELPSGLDYAVFDYAVNSGPVRAVRYLQLVLGVPADGMMGPGTLQAVKASDTASVIKKLCRERLAFLKGLRHWPTFGKGWDRRVESVLTVSLKMAYATAIKESITEKVDPASPTNPPQVIKPTGFWAWIKSLIS